MELYYWQDSTENRANFGDDLNLWLWDHLLPGWRNWQAQATLLGVGTLLNQRNLERYDRYLVVGSGVGYGSLPTPELMSKADIRCVRGPKSAARLGISKELGIVDPAVTIPDLQSSLGLEPYASGQIFIPHIRTAQIELDWEGVCQRAGLSLLMPWEKDKKVIEAIAGAELVVTESMHGAILADAFRVPWVAVRLSDHFNFFKWQDWANSLGLTLDVVDTMSMLRPPFRLLLKCRNKLGLSQETFSKSNSIHWYAEKMRSALETRLGSQLRKARQQKAQLSEQAMLEDRKARFYSILDEIRIDYGG